MAGDDDKGRGSYKCGRCGVPKKGHVCPYQPKVNNENEVVKQESNQEEEPRQAAPVRAGGSGVIPFFVDCRAVSPGATPHKNKKKNSNAARDEDDDDDESCASNGTSGAVAESNVGNAKCASKKAKRTHKSSDSEGEEESEGEDLDENDIILSTNLNEKYKAIMIRHWGELWGEQRKDGLKAAKLSWEVLAELKGLSGGSTLYRKSNGENAVHEATDDEARKKITVDLSRGRREWKGSIFHEKNNDDLKRNETESDDLLNNSKVTNKHGRDLLVSLLDAKYNKIVADRVQLDLFGQHSGSLAGFATDLVTKVTNDGGRILKPKNHRSLSELVEICDGVAVDRIIQDIQGKLAVARKDNKCIAIVHKKNDEYKQYITEGVQALAKDHDESPVSSRAEAFGKILFDRWKKSGKKHFFTHSGDDREMRNNEVLDKITKDVQAQVKVCKVALAENEQAKNDSSNQSNILSSTRRKRDSSEQKTIHNDPREYLGGHIVSLIAKNKWKGMTRKSKSLGGLSVDVAIRDKTGEKFTGYSEILDEAYVSGYYDTAIVCTEEGQVYLENSGIREEPYSIFSEELKRKRKRRKLGHDETNQLLGNNHSDSQQHGNVTQGVDVAAANMNINVNAVSGGNSPAEANETADAAKLSAKDDRMSNTEQDAEAPSRESVEANSSHTAGVTTQAQTIGHDTSKTTAGPPANSIPGGMPANKSFLLQSRKAQKRKFWELYGRVNKLLDEGKGNGNEWDKTNIKSLRNEFFFCLKKSLSPKRTLDESTMKEVTDYIDDFELLFSKLDVAVKENDVCDTLYYTQQCEGIIESCKEEFP